MYSLLRKILFFFDAEKVHYFSMNALVLMCKIPGLKNVLRRCFTPKNQHSKTAFGIKFPNQVGLAAGFDKNAKYLNELETLGFGFIEIGTVTPLPQAGNPKSRLFRLPKDKAIINRMGFNNDGVKLIAQRIQKYKLNHSMIIGGNIGKNKITPNEDAWKDYEICFNELHDWVDYFVVNVSSPNTPGLRDLQQKDSLRKILSHLIDINKTKAIQKPLLLKISPDLDQHDLNDVIDLAMEIKLDGLVAANTTITRNNLKSPKELVDKFGAGGLSGKPLNEKSNTITNYIHTKTKGAIPIISSGGIFTSSDAKEKFERGATLVQVWTGFIYEGPGIVKNICNNLN
ncbi:MAG: quinone-dependent dihydroorotate dehydrogenase [Ginsengibacter sp.]